MKFLGTRDIVKLAEVREVRLNEDGHVNASGLITKDAENSANIFKADDTQFFIFTEFIEAINHENEKRELFVNVNKIQNLKTVSSYHCIKRTYKCLRRLKNDNKGFCNPS